MNIGLLNSNNVYNLSLRVVYYARVSTDNDTQSSSIINQCKFFDSFINGISNWKYVGCYIDEGISGKGVRDRKSFMRMINDGINGIFDLILTKSVSRFARNTIDSIKYTDLLKSKGIGVIFINDGINTFSTDSEFRLTLMASMAQEEIRKLSESIKFGLRQSISRGVVLGSSNILGYKKERGKLIVIPEEAIIVRDIFNLFVFGNYNYSGLARVINKKYHRRFDSTGIKRILSNYKYKGYYCGRKSLVINYKNNRRINFSCNDWIIYRDNINVPSIVSEDVWNRAFLMIKDKSRVRRGFRVKCLIHNKYCRYVVRKYKDSVYRYYICSGCVSFNEDLLDRFVGLYSIKVIYLYKCFNVIKVVLGINL